MALNSDKDDIIRRIQEREVEQTLLLSLNRLLAPVTNLLEFDDFINSLKTHIPADNFIICISDEAEKEYSVFYHNDKARCEALRTERFATKDDFFSTALNSADPITVTSADVNSKSGNTPGFLSDLFKSGIREVISYPLYCHNNIPAVVFIGLKKQGTLNRNDLRLLNSLSHQMAITLDNIHLRQKLYLHTSNQLKITQEVISDERGKSALEAIVGTSEVMQLLRDKVLTVAKSDTGVLLLGESGTGKEMAARAIHENSERCKKEMVKVNCAAIPKNLIESELFGHEKGSFTGAVQLKTGKFERANNSTLFLDEIGELPLELQVKLLRVLQEQEIERIGGSTTIRVNVRIIAATNRDLQKEVALGNFRADLFYRLNIFPIHIPALREHLEDIDELSRIFIDKFSIKSPKVLAAKALAVMKLYSWPGNIRELQHTMERAVLLTTGPTIKEVSLTTISPETNKATAEFSIKPLADFEREYIVWILSKCNGRISGPNGAAALLGLPPTTLQSKMVKLGIKKKHFAGN